MCNCTSYSQKKASISTQTNDKEIKKNEYIHEPIQGVPIPQTPNSKFIIFDFDDGKRHFVGSFSKDITTKYVYEYVKKELLEQKLIKQNNDIKIVTIFGSNMRFPYKTIDEIFEKNRKDPYYVENCGFTKEQQEIIMKLKIIITNIENIDLSAESSQNIKTKYTKYYQIFIKLLTGERIAYQYNPEMTVGELQILISDTEGIPLDQQRLIYNCHQLEYRRTCSFYKIEPESTIHLVLRLSGGMFIEITSGNIDYQNIKNCKVDFNFDKN